MASRQTLTLAIGAFLVLLETLTLRSRPKDILNRSKLGERVFEKLWLRVGRSEVMQSSSKYPVGAS